MLAGKLLTAAAAEKADDINALRLRLTVAIAKNADFGPSDPFHFISAIAEGKTEEAANQTKRDPAALVACEAMSLEQRQEQFRKAIEALDLETHEDLLLEIAGDLVGDDK